MFVDHKGEGFFPGARSAALICVSVFMPVPGGCDDRGLALSFGIG